MSKFVSGVKNKNITVDSNGLTTVNISTAISGNTVQTPTTITSTSTLSITTGNTLIIANPSSAITINLPASPNPGQIYKIINISSYDVTVNTNNASNFFDGQGYTSITMSRFDKLNITYYNTNWFLI